MDKVRPGNSCRKNFSTIRQRVTHAQHTHHPFEDCVRCSSLREDFRTCQGLIGAQLVNLDNLHALNLEQWLWRK